MVYISSALGTVTLYKKTNFSSALESIIYIKAIRLLISHFHCSLKQFLYFISFDYITVYV